MTDPRKLPVTIADGDDVAIGTKSDAAATDSTSSWSLIALAKGVFGIAQSMQIWWSNRLGIKTSANSLSVTPASDAVTVVSGYAADGQAPTNPSVLIGAKTPAGLKKTLTVDTAGLYTRNMLIDTTGAYGFSPDYCSCVNTYNTDGTINYVTYTDPITNYSFRRTYTWTSGKITSFTGWVKQ